MNAMLTPYTVRSIRTVLMISLGLGMTANALAFANSHTSAWPVRVYDDSANPAGAVAKYGPVFTDFVSGLYGSIGIAHPGFNVTSSPSGTLVADAVAAGDRVVFSQPAHVALLVRDHGYRIAATLENKRLGFAESRSGGVFITPRNSRFSGGGSTIASITDCAAPRSIVAAVSRRGFGGFVVQVQALADAGLPYSQFEEQVTLIETGSQPAVVDHVNAGNVTCGFVRTDMLEGIAALDPQRTGNVQVVGQRTDPAGLLFPFALSTDLYPEWSVAVAPSVEEGELELLTQALLRLRDTDAAAAAGDFSRFVPAPSHDSVVAALITAGAIVIPDPPAAAGDDGTMIIALGSSVGATLILLVATGIVVHKLSNQDAADLALAPKDEAAAFTVVFTDIQGSTALWATDPTNMGPATDAHHETLRRLLRAHRGYEVKTIGDSFMVAFEHATDAVAFGVAVQSALAEPGAFHSFIDDLYTADVPERAEQAAELYRQVVAHSSADDAAELRSAATKRLKQTRAVLAQHTNAAEYARNWRGLRVRIGVHTGKGEIKLDPTTQRYDYYGTVVNTAARIEAAAHGGQLLVSAATLAACGRDTEEDEALCVTNLGLQAFAGLSEQVSVSQVLPSEFADRAFLPLRTLGEAQLVGDGAVHQDADNLCGSPSYISGLPPATSTTTAVSASDDAGTLMGLSSSAEHHDHGRRRSYATSSPPGLSGSGGDDRFAHSLTNASDCADDSDDVAAARELLPGVPAADVERLQHDAAHVQRLLQPLVTAKRREVVAAISGAWRVALPLTLQRRSAESPHQAAAAARDEKLLLLLTLQRVQGNRAAVRRQQQQRDGRNTKRPAPTTPLHARPATTPPHVVS